MNSDQNQTTLRDDTIGGHTPELVARAWDPIGWDWYDRNKESENAATQEARQIFLADQTKRATAVLGALPLT